MAELKPTNLQGWIDANRDRLKPPVGNADIWQCRDFMVTMVGGPNRRKDYHINPTEEFFHQIEGEMTLKTIQDGRVVDIPIRAGEIFMLPAGVPHSPRRPAGTIGMVIEVKSESGRRDGFVWLCENCGEKLWETYRLVTSIVTDLPPVFDEFYGDPRKCTCPKCGMRQER